MFIFASRSGVCCGAIVIAVLTNISIDVNKPSSSGQEPLQYHSASLFWIYTLCATDLMRAAFVVHSATPVRPICNDLHANILTGCLASCR